MSAEKQRALVVYGSQTGQSKSIAEEITSKIEQLELGAEIVAMDQSIEKMPWRDYAFTVFVTSSTGDGDPPENAVHFWRKIRSKDLGEGYLSHVRYALLGLGDTNYTTFLGFPKGVDKQLKRLGARPFLSPGWADDAVGLEIVVDPWIENLMSAIENTKYLEGYQLPALPKADEPTIQTVSSLPEKAAIPEKSDVITNGVPKDDTTQDEEVENLINNLRKLNVCSEQLNGATLKIPVLPIQFLDISFNTQLKLESQPDDSEITWPLARSKVIQAPVVGITQLTSDHAVKTTLELTIGVTELDQEYQPGDTIGVICSNNPSEVDALVKLLKAEDYADVPYELKVKEAVAGLKSGSKAKYEVPSHIPRLGTLRSTLTRFCDIRGAPKKALIRTMAECAGDENEKRRLLELCSLQGSQDYVELIREHEINVIDLLTTFSSVALPVERFLEHVPRLLPRPYSISSSPLKDPNVASFVFNVVDFPAKNGRTYPRQGLATGRFHEMFREPGGVAAGTPHLSVYLRTNHGFAMPASAETPLILVGPGTGVGPFLGFAAEREALVKRHPDARYGPLWLFYGCRHKERDYLHRAELERWHSTGILTRLHVSFSRDALDPTQPRYVQDSIRRHESGVVRLVEKGAVVYVCGDAKNMAKDVMQAFVEAFRSVRGLGEQDARERVLQLQKEKRYLQDIWA